MTAIRNLPMAEMPAESSALPLPTVASRPRALMILSVVTFFAVVAGIVMALAYPGTDIDQGEIQRIFYLHVPSFAGAFVAFGAAVVGGIGYLLTRKAGWDRLALAGAEVGLVLALINLATGMIWARPIWNTWWTWDPRLTSAAIMALTYFAYLMLRNGIENVETRRRFAAVFGILAFASVIVTLVITRIRPDTIHPVLEGVLETTIPFNSEGAFVLSQRITATVGYNSAVWSILLPWCLMAWRMRLERASDFAHALRSRIAEA